VVAIADTDSLVLDCYRLARWYQQSPDVFLEMPISKVRTHLTRSIQLAERMRQEQEDAADDNG
jgi:hypothetical protein